MDKQTKENTTPYFFLINEKYIIGTPRSMSASDQTMDVKFNDFATDWDLQKKLNLGSYLMESLWVGSCAHPFNEKKLIDGVAVYLAAFAANPEEEQQRRDYLMKNGLIRILIQDDKLKEELMSKTAEE